MNRETEAHFSEYPKLKLRRSKFDESHSNKTTFNAGEIIPIYIDSDIIPGDTVQMDMAEMVRMATPIYPVMDNAFLDVMFFFVPHRLVWEHWEQFWGQNDDPWTQQIQYEIPQLDPPTGGWTTGTIADYMGVPINVEKQINALPFRAYAKVWNDWFRDENIKTACHVYTDETTRTGQIGTESGYSYVTGAELGGLPLKAAKFHGYFTSALPSTQKGPAVTIPIGAQNMVPIVGGELSSDVSGFTTDTTLEGKQINGVINANTFNIYGLNNTKGIGLYAELDTATQATINDLRTAFAIQKYYENCGIKGTRYIEWIAGVFGVQSSDARLQRSEYEGGFRVPINMDQILQTSSTDATSPQGNTAGFSCTFSKNSLFTRSFEEHGTLIGVAVVRTDRTYQQGLSKMWTRKKWTDFYNPFFANLGEQAILNENIYAQGDTVVDSDGNVIDEQAFGFQEAWADYRYKENRTSGYMRSTSAQPLDAWHYGDDYSSLPYLSSDWIDEPTANVDRVIAASSNITHQFIGDFFFKVYYTRCMPVYSVPGLIDHV